jgi:hypothetical protein
MDLALSSLERFIEIANSLSAILGAIIPVAIFSFYRIYKLIKQKIAVLQTKELNDFKHMESCHTIAKLTEFVNLYKDKSKADAIIVLQFVNGTVATNGLDNMYVNCLIEDTRYGNLPKKYDIIQREPYHVYADFIGPLNRHGTVFEDTDLYTNHKDWTFKPVFRQWGSCLATACFNKDMIISAVILFGYEYGNYNGLDTLKQKDHLCQLRTTYETLLLEYLFTVNRKATELHVAIDLQPRTIGGAHRADH